MAGRGLAGAGAATGGLWARPRFGQGGAGASRHGFAICWLERRRDGGVHLWPAAGREPVDCETPASCVPEKAAWPGAGWLLGPSVP